MKKFLPWVIVAAMVVVVAFVYLSNSELYQGRLSLSSKTTLTASSCGSQWAKIFDGTADMSGNLNATKALSEKNIQKLLTNGCSFKVVKDYVDSHSAHFVKSFDCAIADYQSPTNGFTCISSPHADQNYSTSRFMTIGFVQGIASTYRGTENNEAGESITVSIFTKK